MDDGDEEGGLGSSAGPVSPVLIPCDDTSSAAPDAADAGIVMHVSSSLVTAVLALAGSKLQDLWSGTPGVRAAGMSRRGCGTNVCPVRSGLPTGHCPPGFLVLAGSPPALRSEGYGEDVASTLPYESCRSDQLRDGML